MRRRMPFNKQSPRQTSAKRIHVAVKENPKKCEAGCNLEAFNVIVQAKRRHLRQRGGSSVRTHIPQLFQCQRSHATSPDSKVTRHTSLFTYCLHHLSQVGIRRAEAARNAAALSRL